MKYNVGADFSVIIEAESRKKAEEKFFEEYNLENLVAATELPEKYR